METKQKTEDAPGGAIREVEINSTDGVLPIAVTYRLDGDNRPMIVGWGLTVGGDRVAKPEDIPSELFREIMEAVAADAERLGSEGVWSR